MIHRRETRHRRTTVASFRNCCVCTKHYYDVIGLTPERVGHAGIYVIWFVHDRLRLHDMYSAFMALSCALNATVVGVNIDMLLVYDKMLRICMRR